MIGVSRDAYELAIEQLRKAEKRADDAEARLHALRLLGGNEPTPPIVRTMKEPDALVSLINEKAGGDRGLRARMLHQLRMDRMTKDDVEIQREIEHGLSTAGIP